MGNLVRSKVWVAETLSEEIPSSQQLFCNYSCQKCQSFIQGPGLGNTLTSQDITYPLFAAELLGTAFQSPSMILPLL